MFRSILILLSLPLILLAQYWGDRALEKSFEKSDTFYESHYLNTFGLYRFKEVSPGLINDPFLNIYLNPANLPDIDKNTHIYLDFRGDRTEILRYSGTYPGHLYDLSMSSISFRPDPRFYTTIRKEPQPVFSLGVLHYPFGKKGHRPYIGATVQMIHKNEPYYEHPGWIYLSRWGYDAFGGYNDLGAEAPVHGRSAGQDEITIQGDHLSAFAGMQLTEKMTLGFSFNGVDYDRDGAYSRLNQSEYNPSQTSSYSNEYSRAKDQSYQHYDIAGGLNYSPAKNWTIGLKTGILKGETKQNNRQKDNSRHHHEYDHNFDEFSKSMYLSETKQHWEDDGYSQYAGFNVQHQLRNKSMFRAYYRFTDSNIDYLNNSAVSDTSFYESQWHSSNYGYRHYSNSSSITDNRRGNGERDISKHEAMASLDLPVSKTSSINIGLYYRKKTTDISGSEPVIANRFSEGSATGAHPNYYLVKLYENKNINWDYSAEEWTIQIPVILNFNPNKYWQFSLGINRILEGWDITEITSVYFTKRRRETESDITSETHFIERYTEPRSKISETYTDVIGRARLNVSDDFHVQIMVDPEFEEEFRIAQWWLSFGLNL